MLAMTIIFATIVRIYLGILNKRLDREEGIDLAHPSEEHGIPELAATRGFRFLL